jgi:hypothetical protein
MNRLSSAAVAIALGIGLFGTAGCSSGQPEATKASPEPAAAVSATAGAEQSPEGAPAQEAIAKTRYIPPVRGKAEIAYTAPQVKVVGDEVITTIRMRNMSTGRIAGLKVDGFWYDKAGNPAGGSSFRMPKPVEPGEVVTITLKSIKPPAGSRDTYQFVHANGEIVPKLVKKLDEVDEEAAKKK